MGFIIFITAMNLLLPVIMLVIGYRFRIQGPKVINGIYGYRTTMSMKNRDTWDYAHQYCGRLWIKLGWVVLVPSLAFSILTYYLEDTMQGIFEMLLVTIQMVVIIASIYPVEKALKENFDENGNKRITK